MGYNERFLQSLRWIRVKVILKKQNSCFISQWSLFKVETLYIKHRNMMLNAKKKKCQNSRKEVSKFINPVLESTVLSFWKWGPWDLTDLGTNTYLKFVEMWIDLATVIQNEVSQKEENKYYILIHIYMESINNGIDELICKIETQT